MVAIRPTAAGYVILRRMGCGRSVGPVCEEPILACVDDGTTARMASPPPTSLGGVSVEHWSTIDKIASAIRRALPHLSGEAASKLAGLLSPVSLGILAGTLVVWAYSHAIGVGEAIDILIAITGFLFVGWEAWSAIKHLVSFARLSVGAKTESDLDSAGDHLAKAVTIIGIDVVIILITHRSTKAWQGRYKPTVTGDPTWPAGAGETQWNGDITYSTAGTAEEQALALNHELGHSFLRPKLQALREWRMNIAANAYWKSQLLRYLEEALVEAYSQLRVNGVKGLPAAFKFPFNYPIYQLTVTGVLKEASIAGLIYVGLVTVGGLTYYVYLEEQNSSTAP